MAAMDHVKRDGICIWCHERWPCPTALIRRELADHLRSLPLGSTGDADYDSGREMGVSSAADTIDAQD